MKFLVDKLHLVDVLEFLDAKDTLGSHIEDLYVAFFTKGDQADAEVLKNGSEVLVVGLLLCLILL